MSEHTSAKVFPPGRLLLEELEQRGWSQADFATIIGRPPRVVNEIIKAKRAITPETAVAVAGALGTDAEFWMNMETSYQLSKVRIELEPIAKRAQIYKRFPVRDMQRRGWIATTNNLEKLERSLLTFLGVDDIDADLSPDHAAKRKSYDEEISPLQAVWLARARQLSDHVKVKKTYRSAELKEVFKRLRALLQEPEDVKYVPEILSSAGIRLIVIEPIVGSKIDGACFWLEQTEPVIVLSLRYDRHDMFWHALFHELDHIDHEEGKSRALIDKDLFKSDQNKPPQEMRADSNAADKLLAKEAFDSFVASANKSYSEEKITQFSARMKVHPGIVVGQLQHYDRIPWSSYNFLKSKIRPFLVAHVLTDGFGAVVK